MTLNGAHMGDEAYAAKDAPIELSLFSLRGGDVIHIVTDSGAEKLVVPENVQEITLNRTANGAKYVRLEVWRQLASMQPVMISNPLYLRRSPSERAGN
jgi:hypothetical protein